MLSDPLVINHGQTISVAGGVPSNFRRTAIGKYISQDGAFTSDQLARFNILPRVALNGPSTYKTKWEMDKNVSPVNGIQQQDDTLSVEIIVRGNLRSFTTADFVNALASASYTTIVSFPRILGGES